MQSKYKFKLEVKNNPPYFQESLEDQTLFLGYQYQYSLPSCADDEGLPITVIPKMPLPSFIFFHKSNNTFSIYPRNMKDAGNHTIKICLTDQYSPFNCYSMKV
jgi:hypothetical protein